HGGRPNQGTTPARLRGRLCGGHRRRSQRRATHGRPGDHETSGRLPCGGPGSALNAGPSRNIGQWCCGILGVTNPALLLSLALIAEARAEPRGACFDFDHKITQPLREPLPLVEGRDNSDFGTYANGIDWAAGRAVRQMPIASAYAKLLDHQNVKDMEKT